MTQIYVKYNPYRMETEILANGNRIPDDSSLWTDIRGKRLQEWISEFPKDLVEEFNTLDLDIEFYGMPLDWDDFVDSFTYAKDKKIINNLNLKFTEGRTDEDINEKIVNIFEELRNGPVDDFKDGSLEEVFYAIKNDVFPINVVATMSSGKSTLINALLEKKLMPSRNEACTATITEILDNDSEEFTAAAYDDKNSVLRKEKKLDYTIMENLNDDEKVHKIVVEGNIPFVDAQSTALKLVDTPGSNNSQNQAHKNTTYSKINRGMNNLILYVLNGTQLSTNDDAELLKYASEQIEQGGKKVRDRFLFVINKMDQFDPDNEDIARTISRAKEYLEKNAKIKDPQIFPCSAYTALNIRTYLKEVDIASLNMFQLQKLPIAAKEAITVAIPKFNNYKPMHLEDYSTLSPSVQRKLKYRLKQAEEKGDIKEQALIHCGIYSIEEAIKAYVKKYAKTKKVKDLVEFFNGKIEGTQILVKMKTKVATDEQAAKACAERAAAVKAKIEDGKAAEVFKRRIEILGDSGIQVVREKASKLKEEALVQPGRIFATLPEILTSEEQAKLLVEQFAIVSSDCTARLSAELENTINHAIIGNAQQILEEYKKELTKIDDESTNKHLEFDTVDLIQGSLYSMQERVDEWCSKEFAAKTVDDVSEVFYEEHVYYTKDGQVEEVVPDGTEDVKIGTKRVRAGSHTETSTRTVKNPKKSGFFGFLKFWEDDYIDEEVEKEVDDYKDEDVYKTIVKYKTVMRDVYKEHREQVKNFSVETKTIQVGLISKLQKNLQEGVDAANRYAEEQIKSIQDQFKGFFNELDKVIKEKYTELEKCATDQKTKENELKKNQEILEWIESKKEELDNILDI